MAIPFIAAAMGLSALAQTVSNIGAAKRQYKWNKRAAEDSNRMNRENEQWLLEQQKSIQAEQREYDSPSAQMARLKAAGLNPNMIYGNGSSAGSAFPINAPGVPGVNVQSPNASLDFSGFISAAQAASTIQLQQTKVAESNMKTQAMEIQNEIAKTNPMLKPDVAAAVSDAMMEVASAKAQEAFIMRSTQSDGSTLISRKVNADVEALQQKLGLNTADLAIKNKILESKEFENAIKEIQMKWLKDSEITPEHVRQGLMLLLSKMLGR